MGARREGSGKTSAIMTKGRPAGNGSAGVTRGGASAAARWPCSRAWVAYLFRHRLPSPQLPVRLTRAAILSLLALAATGTSAAAQDSPLLLEVSGGVAIPNGSFADGTAAGEGAETGAAFGVGFTLRRSERIAFYLGFDQQRFGCEPAGCSAGGSYTATGFDLGLRFAIVPGERFEPWIRASAITTRVETGDLPDPNAGVSSLGWGAELALGVFLGTDWIGVTPTVAYAFVDTDLPGGDTLGLRYLTAYLGLTLPF